ncbi:DMT family transporter [Streptomyces sp. PU-14G]|uniref:DMT family transporter n=1 Tax=Streptomyces sp. PU-14G TaxID=2800808 RepID=UPI0034DECD1E
MWSSGFISGSLGLRHAAPYTFAALRFALAGTVLLLWMALRRRRFPGRVQLLHLCVVGVLVQAVQFSSICQGMALGVPPGLAALITALYPLVASLLAVPLLRESVGLRAGLGLVLGFTGVALMMSESVRWSSQYVAGFGFVTLGLVGISLGTVYQKRFCRDTDPVSGSAVQLVAASVVMVPPAVGAEGWSVEFTTGFWPVLFWTTLVNSILGVGLLYHLLRHHGTDQVTSLFYLVLMVATGFSVLLLGDRVGALVTASCAENPVSSNSGPYVPARQARTAT